MKRMPRWGEGMRWTLNRAGRAWVFLLLGLVLTGGTMFSLVAPMGCDQDRKMTDQHERILQQEEE